MKQWEYEAECDWTSGQMNVRMVREKWYELGQYKCVKKNLTINE
jgi:hypothetical protein